MSNKSATLHGERVFLQFPKDWDIITWVKSLPDRRFENGYNGIPVGWMVTPSRDGYSDFINQLEEFGFDVTQEVKDFKPSNLRVIKIVNLLAKIDFPYDGSLVADVKAIDGARFDKSSKVWLLKLESETQLNDLLDLAQEHDFDLEGKEAALAALEERVAHLKERVEMSASQEANIEISGLNDGLELRPFQQAGVAYALSQGNKIRTYLGHEMGLGKTPMGVCITHAKQAFPALVVCPASLCKNWEREFKKWLPDVSVSLKAEKDADVTVLSYEMMSKRVDALKAKGLQSVIFDESHYLKNFKAARTQKATELVQAINPPVVLSLSGTAITNRPNELVPQLEILGKIDEFGGRWNFLTRYCNAKKTRFGWDFSGAAHLDELNTKLRQSCYVRVKKDEVLTELPPKQFSTYDVPLSNRKDYNQAERDFVSYLKELASDDKTFWAKASKASAEERERMIAERNDAGYLERRANVLAQLTALRGLCAKGKVEEIVKWVADFQEQNENQKLVVFAHHVEVQQELAKRIEGAIWTREKGKNRVDEQVQRFNTDPRVKVLVASLAGDSTGHTMVGTAEHPCSNLLVAEMGWTPAILNQAHDRIHRIGQTAQGVNIYTIHGERSIDQRMQELIDEKTAIMNKALDGNADQIASTSIVKDLLKSYLGDASYSEELGSEIESKIEEAEEAEAA